MKIVIYYDLENAIRNVDEPFGPFKVVRNCGKEWGMFLPFSVWMNYLLNGDLSKVLPTLAFQYLLFVSCEMMSGIASKDDFFESYSRDQLNKLGRKLEAFQLSTDFSLIRQMHVYDRNYAISVNEKMLPKLREEKFFLVPFYERDGKVRERSLLQTHNIGSKEYVLTLQDSVRVDCVSYIHS